MLVLLVVPTTTSARRCAPELASAVSGCITPQGWCEGSTTPDRLESCGRTVRRPALTSDGEPMTHRRFEFRVQGPLSESAQRALDGLVIVNAPQEVIIFGEVIDESHLHGILALVRSLDLHLVSMHEVPGQG